jgi:hypothetical protein
MNRPGRPQVAASPAPRLRRLAKSQTHVAANATPRTMHSISNPRSIFQNQSHNAVQGEGGGASGGHVHVESRTYMPVCWSRRHLLTNRQLDPMDSGTGASPASDMAPKENPCPTFSAPSASAWRFLAYWTPAIAAQHSPSHSARRDSISTVDSNGRSRLSVPTDDVGQRSLPARPRQASQALATT